MINYCLVLLFQTTTTTTGNFTLDWKWQLKSIINSWMDCASRETHPNETRIAPTPFTAKLKSWSFFVKSIQFFVKGIFCCATKFFSSNRFLSFLHLLWKSNAFTKKLSKDIFFVKTIFYLWNYITMISRNFFFLFTFSAWI